MPGSLHCAQRRFQEHHVLYDTLLYQLNPIITTIKAFQVGIGVRAARNQADIRSFFTQP